MKAMTIALALLLAAGCTNSTLVSDSRPQPPASKYGSIVVGDVAASAPEAASLAPYFRTGFLAQIRKEAGVTEVIDNPSATPANGGLKFTGDLTGVDLGNAAARIIIGFGAGAQQLSGRFQMRSATNDLVGQFEARESYAGGIGIGGASVLSIQEIGQKFGEATARNVGRWMRGESLR